MNPCSPIVRERIEERRAVEERVSTTGDGRVVERPVRAIHSRASAGARRGWRAREGWLMTQAEGSKERLENEEWRLTMLAREDCPEDPQSVPGDIALYGEWQTEP